MKYFSIILIILAFTLVGFLLGQTYPFKLSLLAEFGVIISAFATVFTASIAYSALDSWKEQAVHKAEIEYSLKAFELLSDIKISSKVYSEALLEITGAKISVEFYFEKTAPFTKQLREYARLYARLDFLGLTNIQKNLKSAVEINSEVNSIVFSKNKSDELSHNQKRIDANEQLDKIFKDSLSSLRAVSPTAKNE